MERREQFHTFGEVGSDAREPITEHAVLVETPEALFRIAYGKHNTPQPVEDIGKPDGLVLEFIANYATMFDAIGAFEDISDYTQYKKLVRRIQNERIPLFLVDMGRGEVATTLQMMLKSVEPAIGLLLLMNFAGDIIKDNSRKNEITRRDFLRKSLKGLASVYFLSHLTPSLLLRRQVNERTALRAIDRFLFDLNERIHPETESIILTFRNYLIAQKLKVIAQTQFARQEEKPEISIVIGAAHIGIEDALRETDEERKKLIEKCMNRPLLHQLKESITRIARFDYVEPVGNQDSWKITIFGTEEQSGVFEEGTFLNKPPKATP